MLKLPKRFNQGFGNTRVAPTGAVVVDYSNPLADGLTNAYLFNRPLENLVSGYNWSTSPGVTRNGDRYEFHRASSDSLSIPNIDNPNSELTVLAAVNYSETGFDAGLFYSGVGIGNPLFWADTITGTLRAAMYCGVPLYAANNSLPINTDLIWGGTAVDSTNTGELYVNGVRLATGSIGTSAFSFSNVELCNSSSRWADSAYKWYYIWNRKLSASEIKSITDNPFQIFKPANDLYYFPVSGAAPAGFSAYWITKQIILKGDSMKKNVASQVIGVQMITAADGTAFTGAVTALITVDGGTQSASGGTGPTSEGNGLHTYIPTQAETNGDHIAFTFTGTGAIPATIQVYTGFPQTVDNNVLAAGATGFAAIDTVVDSILVDTGTTIPATIATAQADLDIITGVSGVNLLTATQASIDAIETDTGTTVPAQIAALNNVAATDIVSAGAITTLTGAVVNVDLVDTLTTYTGNTVQTGDSFARLGAPAGASVSADIAAVPTVVEILTTAMTEAYAADGVAPTLAQAIFLIQQTVGEFAISGTTITAKKLDGAATAATYTLDDGTSPTSRTRAS